MGKKWEMEARSSSISLSTGKGKQAHHSTGSVTLHVGETRNGGELHAASCERLDPAA